MQSAHNKSKHICCSTSTRIVKVGWLSLQADHSISFGLSDKTFISPKFKFVSQIWNAYNRIGIEFLIASSASGLERVANPHFTYHPALQFHLKDKSAESTLFKGIADVGIVLEQEGVMPWIRAVSAPIGKLKNGSARSGSKDVEEWVTPATSEEHSVQISLDFVKPQDALEHQNVGVWFIKWGAVAVRCKVSFCQPQIPTLSWFYSY